MIKFRPVFNILVFILLFSFGCQLPQGEEIETPQEPQQLEKRFGLGGAPIDVIVSLSSDSIELTDFLTVTVRVEHSDTVRVEPPYLSEAVYEPLLLIQNPQEDLFWSEKQNRIIQSWVYRFEPMKSGEFALHPFRVFFRLESERKPQKEDWPVYKIEISEIPYRVTSVDINDQSDIRDVKGPIQPEYDYVPLILSVSGISLLLFSLWLVVRIRMHLQDRELPAVETIDYLLESLRRLKKLEEKDYISQQQYDRLHVELSAVLRYFIENRFGLKAREQTTEEFIRDIRYSPHFNTEQQSILQQFLELADLVKFATYDPGSEASREAMKTIRYFIESTGKPNED